MACIPYYVYSLIPTSNNDALSTSVEYIMYIIEYIIEYILGYQLWTAAVLSLSLPYTNLT